MGTPSAAGLIGQHNFLLLRKHQNPSADVTASRRARDGGEEGREKAGHEIRQHPQASCWERRLCSELLRREKGEKQPISPGTRRSGRGCSPVPAGRILLRAWEGNKPAFIRAGCCLKSAAPPSNGAFLGRIMGPLPTATAATSPAGSPLGVTPERRGRFGVTAGPTDSRQQPEVFWAGGTESKGARPGGGRR